MNLLLIIITFLVIGLLYLIAGSIYFAERANKYWNKEKCISSENINMLIRQDIKEEAFRLARNKVINDLVELHKIINKKDIEIQSWENECKRLLNENMKDIPTSQIDVQIMMHQI